MSCDFHHSSCDHHMTLLVWFQSIPVVDSLSTSCFESTFSRETKMAAFLFGRLQENLQLKSYIYTYMCNQQDAVSLKCTKLLRML